MRMVASAKLHHTQSMTEHFLHYRDELENIVTSLTPTPLFPTQEENTTAPEKNTSSVLLIPISSNSGLCGAFNSNIAKATAKRIGEWQAHGAVVHLMPIGKKIAHEIKKDHPDANFTYTNLIEKVEKSNDYADVPQLVDYLLQLHQNSAIDNAECIYHHFKTVGTQIITAATLTLVPPTPPVMKESPFLTEPTPDELLTALFPRLLNAQVYGLLLDSLTSEHAARMLAMQTADDNANDLLAELTLLYNKTRQQAITNELIDIMGGRIEE